MALESCSWVKSVVKQQTNIVVFHVVDSITNLDFIKRLEESGIKSIPFGPGRVRMVTHLDISDDDVGVISDKLQF